MHIRFTVQAWFQCMYNNSMQLPDVIDRIRPSIVQIRKVGPTIPPQGQTLGTGFTVTDAQHIITALHVVEEVNSSSGEVLRIAFAGPEIETPDLKLRGNFVQVNAQIIAENQDQDLALIRAPDFNKSTLRVKFGDGPVLANPPAAKLFTGKVREGVELAVSGYPLNEPSLVTNAGILASTFSFNNKDGRIQACYLGDFTANPGNSGGPVYTARDGSIIGVCVGGRVRPILDGIGKQNSGLTTITPIEQVVEILKTLGLDPAAATGHTSRPAQKKRRR